MRLAVFSKFSKLQFVLHIFFFYEITTPVMRTMQIMVNIFQVLISDIVHIG